MCPGTLALVGAGLSAGGALYGGISQAGAASYQGQVAKNNATIETQNARYAASAAAANTETAALKARSRNASVRAGLAANNVDVNSGSAADTQESQRRLSALDVATTANNAALQVYGYQTQATNYQAQAKLDQAEVLPDILGGALKAGGALLSNPSVDSAIGGGDIEPVTVTPGNYSSLPDYKPEAATATPSVISSAPTVPADYEWMQPGYGQDD